VSTFVCACGLKLAPAAWNSGRPGEGIVHLSKQFVGFLLADSVAEAVAKLLPGQRHRGVDVAWVPQCHERDPQRRDRQREHSLDRRGVDPDRRGGVSVAEQLLGEQTAERVPNDDRAAGQRCHVRGVVLGNLVDSVVRDRTWVGAGRLNGVGVTWPARRGRVVTVVVEQLDPRLPRAGVQPQAVNEHHGRTNFSHLCSLTGTLRVEVRMRPST
jgi:hypothetical protein